MIEKKDIQALPFVDGTPDPSSRPDQARIDWIKNGECMSAAETEIGNEGSLNRGAVEVQQNVAQVQENVKTVKSSVDEVIEIVNRHSEIINQEGDLDLIETSKKHTDEIETLNYAVVQISDRVDGVSEIANDNKAEIGVVPEHDTADRTIRDELEWQKTEMGSYPGFDYNGLPDIDSRGTGVKLRVINNSMAISNHQGRINKLETEWQISDVGSLTKQVDKLRTEMGPESDKMPGHTVYNRLTTNESKIAGVQTQLKDVNTQIGITTFPRPEANTLINLVDLNASNISQVNSSLVEEKSKILVLQTQVGDKDTPNSIIGKQEFMTKDIKELQDIVGKSNSEGLRYSVVVLETEIGNDGTPGSLKNRMILTENGIRDLNVKIDELNDILGVNGSSSNSINDRITELELQTNGDANGETDFEKAGMYRVLYELTQTKPVADVTETGTWIRETGKWTKLGAKDIDLDPIAKIKSGLIQIIAIDNNSIVLGSNDVSLKIKSDIVGGVFDSNVKMTTTHFNTNQKISGDFATLSPVVEMIGDTPINTAVYTVGDPMYDLRLVGSKVLMNGVELGEGDVRDVTTEGTYLRKTGEWVKSSDAAIPVKGLVSESGAKIIGYDTDGITVGDSSSSVKIVNASTISTKNLNITSGAKTVLKVETDKIVLGDNLYSGTDKIWTDKEDAPSDTKYYARRDGMWEKIDPTGGGDTGIGEAPIDGQLYGRGSREWKAIGSENLNLADNIAIQWETATDSNFTSIKYDKSKNELSVGGSGAKVSILGDVRSFIMEKESVLQNRYTAGAGSALTSDSDDNVYVGDASLAKAVTLRAKEDPKAQTKDGLFTIWHSGMDAKADGQIYGRKDNKWVVFEVNKTKDIILNSGVSYKVNDAAGKTLKVLTSGGDNLIELGERTSLININSTVRYLNLDNKVKIKSGEIDLIGLNDDSIELGSLTKALVVKASTATLNGNKIITSADDAPKDSMKYVRQNGAWTTAYQFGEDAPSAVGAKEGDVYFQYM